MQHKFEVARPFTFRVRLEGPDAQPVLATDGPQPVLFAFVELRHPAERHPGIRLAKLRFQADGQLALRRKLVDIAVVAPVAGRCEERCHASQPRWQGRQPPQP
ncbi:MAG: hypothetical protein U5Q44_12730 [Dehalococcoidia bacterium]|nr:hypothetical protein [Dehalococcoidia bacterium]